MLVLKRATFEFLDRSEHFDPDDPRISCARCHKTDLPMSVGCDGIYLCMPCAQQVDETVVRHEREKRIREGEEEAAMWNATYAKYNAIVRRNSN